MRPARRAVLVISALSLAGCAAATGQTTAPSVGRLAHWTAAAKLPRVVDLGGPRRDATLVVAAAGRLALLAPTGALRPFARGPRGYVSPGGEEPYIALSSGGRVAGPRCTFGPDTVYALHLRHGPGVTTIDRTGRARRFATLPAGGLENGIAFDATGRFGHRLLVTSTANAQTAQLLGDSGLPHGQDIGVESLGFVPPRFCPGWSALVADRLTPGNRHPGDGVILRIAAGSLARAGVRPGDLLITTEGGAMTDAITCASTCQVRHVADGPAEAHVEGHIAFDARLHS